MSCKPWSILGSIVKSIHLKGLQKKVYLTLSSWVSNLKAHMFLHSFTKISQICIWYLTVIGSIYHLPYIPETYSHSVLKKRPSDSFSNQSPLLLIYLADLVVWLGVRSNSQKCIPTCHIIVSPIPRCASLEDSSPFILSALPFRLLFLFLLNSFRFSDHRRMPRCLWKQKKWLPHYVPPQGRSLWVLSKLNVWVLKFKISNTIMSFMAWVISN